jgi:cytochrome P450
VSSPGDLRLDPDRLRHLFDIAGPVFASRGGSYDADPHPILHRLRAEGPVVEGVPGPLIGYHGEGVFVGLPFEDRRHFTVLDFETCDLVVRDTDRFTPQAEAHTASAELIERSMLAMEGEQHRTYRALVQPSFVPRRARWWIERWIEGTVDALVDDMASDGRAELSTQLCAPIPLLTICGSFGVGVEDALAIRASVTERVNDISVFAELVLPVIRQRRQEPGDDLLSILVTSSVTDADGVEHTLDDGEVLGFAFLLLAAGSGTTWKQMGITLYALLTHPTWIDVVRADPARLRDVIEEAVRWEPTDPVFARFARRDTELAGVEVPAGSVLHTHFGAANRDPARWDHPDRFDPDRPTRPHLGFGNGPHICLGMHVARAEMTTALAAVVARLPGLRLDPEAPPPRLVGVYERGPDALPVVWDT